jgi:hypothetical protein
VPDQGINIDGARDDEKSWKNQGPRWGNLGSKQPEFGDMILI